MSFPKPPVGHVFVYGAYSDDPVTCTVVGEPEPTKDRFGRTMRQVMIRREDTGAEGWFVFGPNALVFDSAVPEPELEKS